MGALRRFSRKTRLRPQRKGQGMSQPLTLPAPAGAVLLAAALLLLGGCEAIYDDTKGWANRLEASILDAAHDLSEDPDADAPTRYRPETSETGAGAETAALGLMPRPEGTPVLIEPNPAEDLRQHDLLLDELPNPADPPPTKDAKATAPAGDAVAGDTVAGAAEALAKKAETAAAEATKPATADKTAEKAETAALPPAPKRKPEAPQTAAKPKPSDDVAMVLHLSSLRSEGAAKREWSDLQRSFPAALGNLTADIRRTELGDKGVFYRVLAGPLPSRSAAKDACAAVKSKNAKQYCRVMPSRPQG